MLQTTTGSANTRLLCNLVYGGIGPTIVSWNSVSSSSPTFTCGSISTISTNYPLVGFTGILVVSGTGSGSIVPEFAPNITQTSTVNYNYIISTIVGIA